MRPGTQCVNDLNETQFSSKNYCNQDLPGSSKRHSGTTLLIRPSAFLHPHHQAEFNDLTKFSSR